MKRYKRIFNENSVKVGNKVYTYDTDDLKSKAKKNYKLRVKNKMTSDSFENEFPGIIERLIIDDVKAQFSLNINRTPSYNILKPIIQQISKELNIHIFGY